MRKRKAKKAQCTFLGYTAQDFYDLGMKALDRIYCGAGLYTRIDQIAVGDPWYRTPAEGPEEEPGEDEDDLVEVIGAMGRETHEEGKEWLNFDVPFKIQVEPGDSRDFIEGQLYRILAAHEDGEDG